MFLFKMIFDLIALPFRILGALFGVKSEPKPKHDNDTQNHKGWMG